MKDVKVQLQIPAAKTISESFDRPNIFYSVRAKRRNERKVVRAENIDKNEHLVKLLQAHRGESVIIYGGNSRGDRL